jgi:hypothetical protein
MEAIETLKNIIRSLNPVYGQYQTKNSNDKENQTFKLS